MALLSITLFAFANVTTIKADSWLDGYAFDDFTIVFETDIDEVYIDYKVQISGGVTELYIYIPDSNYNAIETQLGSYGYKVYFYDTNANLIDSFNWSDMFTTKVGANLITQLGGYFTLNLINLGIYGEDIAFMRIQVPQDLSALPADATDYLTYLEDNDYILQKYPTYDYQFKMQINSPSYFRAELTVAIPYGTNSIYINELGAFYSNEVGVYKSHIALYDSSDVYLGGAYLSDFDAELDEFIYFPDYGTYDYDDLSYFILYLYVPNWYNGYRDILDINGDFGVTFNDQSVRHIHYISQGIEVGDELVQVPASVEIFDNFTVPSGFQFSSWRDGGGVPFKFYAITEENYPTHDIYLYASFSLDPENIDLDISDPIYDTNNPIGQMLVGFGWNVDTGYMLTFVILVMIATFILVKLNVHVLGITIVDFLIFVLFNYWGMLPNSVSVIGYIFFGVMALVAIGNLGKGGHYNE